MLDFHSFTKSFPKLPDLNQLQNLWLDSLKISFLHVSFDAIILCRRPETYAIDREKEVLLVSLIDCYE